MSALAYVLCILIPLLLGICFLIAYYRMLTR